MTIIQPGLRGHQEVRYGSSGQTLVAWPDTEAATPDPSSATVSIYAPGSTTAIISAASATEDGTTHKLSYDLDASSTGTFPLDEGYRADFAFVVSGKTYHRNVAFDVVRNPIALFCPCRVDDLKNMHKSVDKALTDMSISDAHQRFILPPWGDCLRWVRAQGRRPALVNDADDFADQMRWRAFCYLCLAFRQVQGDLWWQLYEDAVKARDEAIKGTVLRYDDEEVLPTEAKQYPSLQVVGITTAFRDARDNDTSAIQPRFKRGQLRAPGGAFDRGGGSDEASS